MNHAKIDELINDYINNHTCSNYEHRPPTKEDLKAFIFDCMRYI